MPSHNAIVPSYVLEYLLSQYCTTSDPATIESGIETVKQILAKHYVHRNEAGLTRSMIKEKGRYTAYLRSGGSGEYAGPRRNRYEPTLLQVSSRHAGTMGASGV